MPKTKIDFMIVGLPRSGTTWLANLFSTGQIMCVHDPLYRLHYSDWDREIPKLYNHAVWTGVSCTGIWRWPSWLNKHTAPKVIIHRDPEDVIRSLAKIGGVKWTHDLEGADAALNLIGGVHVTYKDLFNVHTLRSLWSSLLPGWVAPNLFDRGRVELLLNMRVEPADIRAGIDYDLQERLATELAAR